MCDRGHIIECWGGLTCECVIQGQDYSVGGTYVLECWGGLTCECVIGGESGARLQCWGGQRLGALGEEALL